MKLRPTRLGNRGEAAMAWLLGALGMTFVQTASSGLAGNDSYYHLKMASLLPELGFVRAFPWLHWTIFRDAFVSHHHGFHLLLVPFVWASRWIGGAMTLGGKAETVVAMGFTALMLWALLKTLGVRHRLAWVALLGCLPWHFWLRLSYVRAPSVALPLLLAAVLLIMRDRPILLGVLAFAFAHLYGGVLLFPLVPLAFLLGHLLTGSPSRRAWLHLGASMTGIAAGLIFNPYFPRNLAFLWTQVFETGLGAPDEVGNEWRSFDAWFLFKLSAPLAALWSACLIRRLRHAGPSGAAGVGILLLNLAFLVLTLKARRFIEYWPAFALLSAADLWNIRTANTGRMPVFRDRLETGPTWKPVPHGRWAGRLRRWLLPPTVAMITFGTLAEARTKTRPNHDHAALSAAMTHLAANSPLGSLVFTDDWDVFPACFYYNHHNHYMVGLDPVFTWRQYPVLWERYRLITRGRTPTTLSKRFREDANQKVALDDIADVFEAQYVVVLADHSKLYRQLNRRSDRFARIYPVSIEPHGGSPPAVSVFRVNPRTQEKESATTPADSY